jgi:hypothetical protein
MCTGDGVADYYGGVTGAGGAITLGLLPARTIGFPQTNAAGLAVDAWGNPIRYVVAQTKINCNAPVAPAVLYDPHFVHAGNLRSNGISCQPNDLLICRSATGITAATCGVTVPAGANQLMTTSLVVAIVFSTGKNGSIPVAGNIDEGANLNGGGNVDPVFVFHTPTGTDFVNGQFDDQFAWITVGELYNRMIAGGVLP